MKKMVMLILVAMIAGCANSPSSEKFIPTEKEQLCSELKRNMIFNTTSGPDFGAASTTQKAEMYRLYEKNNCSKLDKN